jgi:DNA-directed RNA polymerase subunit RPC12/RpoP
MHFKDGDVPIKWVCLNCRSIIVGFQGEDGLTRIKCPHCGTVTVSKLISRRHVQVDVFAPQGQELLRSN